MIKALKSLALALFLCATAAMTSAAQMVESDTNAPITNSAAMTAGSAPASIGTNQATLPQPEGSGNRGRNESPSPRNGPGIWDRVGHQIIPLAGIFVGFAIPVGIIAILGLTRWRREKELHRTLRVMVEKGMPITPELVAALKITDDEAKRGDNVQDAAWSKRSDDSKAPASNKDLRTGLILMGVGAGVLPFLGKMGWVLFFLGLAFLLIWVLTGRTPNDPTPR